MLLHITDIIYLPLNVTWTVVFVTLAMSLQITVLTVNVHSWLLVTLKSTQSMPLAVVVVAGQVPQPVALIWYCSIGHDNSMSSQANVSRLLFTLVKCTFVGGGNGSVTSHMYINNQQSESECKQLIMVSTRIIYKYTHYAWPHPSCIYTWNYKDILVYSTLERIKEYNNIYIVL